MPSDAERPGHRSVAPFCADTAELESRGLLRKRHALDGPQGPVVCIRGRDYLNFCSNDYLGLAADPRVAEALAEGARRYGAGSGASPMVCGRSRAHAELEAALADFLGRDRAVLFSSGYLANLSLVSTLAAGRGDLLLVDRLSHASIIDAGLLAPSRLRRYPHGDAAAAARQLAGPGRKKLVLTDSVFSMDGDIAPLEALAKACARRRALLAVDDAHGFGVVGPEGRGAVVAAGLGQDDVPALVATLGKAVGCAGAFIAGPDALLESVVQRARPYIYSTAPSPALAVAALRALEILRREEWRRQRLQSLVEQFRAGAAGAGIPLQVSGTPIQALILGSPVRALEASERLAEGGVLVTPIRPPTVPPGTSRLRITLSAAHSPAQVDRLLETLAACAMPEPVPA